MTTFEQIDAALAANGWQSRLPWRLDLAGG
jgi:hypothetical protein